MCLKEKLTSGTSVDVTVDVNMGPKERQSHALVIIEKREDTNGSRLLESFAASARANSKKASTFSAALALLSRTAGSVGAGPRLYLGIFVPGVGVTVTVEVARVDIITVTVDVVRILVVVLNGQLEVWKFWATTHNVGVTYVVTVAFALVLNSEQETCALGSALTAANHSSSTHTSRLNSPRRPARMLPIRASENGNDRIQTEACTKRRKRMMENLND